MVIFDNLIKKMLFKKSLQISVQDCSNSLRNLIWVCFSIILKQLKQTQFSISYRGRGPHIWNTVLKKR